ncbi:MAG: peptide-methionine (S)-S-oxide reductase MsrA, partial [Candidatus Thermoplasmatota archaeon]|nr:peptide-methionine (S)-S-oxide reductase MsrA [Candidatus Thermoplasmatota archaeon]
VLETTVGYMGGTTKDPTYTEVCSNTTGHIEVVEITFDPLLLPYKHLLDIFWSIHDPTQENRQGPDVGRQYASIIFYCNDQQKKEAEQSKRILEQSQRFFRKISTEILPCSTFYPAEEYHQKYYQKHGIHGCPIH